MNERLRPFELRSFEDEARAAVEEARAAAREIVRRAEEEGRRIREEAARSGRQEGFSQGRAAGIAEGRESFAREAALLAGALRVAARGIAARQEELAAAAERDLVRLAVAIAEKIVKAEIRNGRPVAAAALRRAVELAARRRRLKVLVHPDDMAVVEACLPALRADFADIGAVEMEASGAVSRGGCVVTTEEGAVDADLRTQLEEIERGLAG